MIREAFAPLGKPIGAVINRSGLGGHRTIYEFCGAKNLPIHAKIPYERTIAEAYAQGRIIADIAPKFREVFINLRNRIRWLTKPESALEVVHA